MFLPLSLYASAIDAGCECTPSTIISVFKPLFNQAHQTRLVHDVQILLRII